MHEDHDHDHSEHEHSHDPEHAREIDLEKESPERLFLWMQHFSRQYKMASGRKARCEDLMRRKKAKTWSPAKTAKMVRRLVTANKEIEQSEQVLENVTTLLQKAGIDVGIVPRSKTVSL